MTKRSFTGRRIIGTLSSVTTRCCVYGGQLQYHSMFVCVDLLLTGGAAHVCIVFRVYGMLYFKLSSISK